MSHAWRATGAVLVASVITTLLAAMAPLATASDTAMRLVDGEGVIHLTNVPADPRYRALTRSSGTAVGWLRLPSRRLVDYTRDIREIARQHDVSATLVESVIRTESGFDPSAVSPKGAAGLMQLMPGTAAALGVPDRFDPRASISGGVRHLRYLLDRYRGDVRLALAAYNAGEAAVDAHRDVPPFPETRAYVERVLGLAGAHAASGARRVIYRYTAPDDTLTYSNVPPPSHQPGPGR